MNLLISQVSREEKSCAKQIILTSLISLSNSRMSNEKNDEEENINTADSEKVRYQ